MNTTRCITVLSALSLAFFAGLPACAQSTTATPKEHISAARPGTDYRSTAWLNDRKVMNSANEQIASVSNVILGRGSGHIDFLVVKTGAVLGLGGKEVAIPYGAFQWSRTESREPLILPSSAEQLKQFPEFSAEEWSAMAESKEERRGSLLERLTAGAPRDADPYADSLKTAKKAEIKGTVTRIDRTGTDGFGEQTTITVLGTDNTSRKIALGPSWFVNGGPAELSRGEHVDVDFLTLPRDPGGMGVATQLKIGGREVRLRDPDGTPAWMVKSAKTDGKSGHFWRYILLSHVQRATINCRGVACGQVHDAIFDRASGQIAFLSIDPNENFLGVKDTKRLIPWSVVTVSVDGAIRADASKEMILASLETPEDPATLNTGTRAAMVYNAFQVAPPDLEPVKAATLETPNTSDAWLATGPIVSGIDISSTKTVRGAISDLSEVGFSSGTQPARAIKVKTGNTEETFLLGPAWYITKQNLEWKTGDPVAIEVSRTTINGAPFWLVRSADVKGKKTEFIGSGNTPAWDRR